MIPADSSLFFPQDALAVGTASVDYDLTAAFAGQPYVRGLYNSGSAGAIKVKTAGGNDVTYASVPAGGRILGYFVTLYKSGTAQTAGWIAEK